MSLKDVVGILSVLIMVGATWPYLYKVLRDEVRPHVFSWLIWTLTTGIAAAARTVVHAGPGAWSQWAGALSCLIVALFTLSKTKQDIKRSDIVAFVLALSAIPAWMMTQNPLVAVIIVTCIDVAGYYPTFRKSYRAPHHEMFFNYIAAGIINALSLWANTDYSLTSTLFSSVMIVANTVLIVFILWRRRSVPKAA